MNAQDYLHAALRLDPEVQGLELIELHADYLGLREPERSSARPAVDRADARRQVAAIASDLWGLAEADVAARLGDLDLTDYPDLDAWRDRLLRARRFAGVLEHAERDSRLFPELPLTLRALAVAPDEAQTTLRDRFVSTHRGRRAVMRSARYLRKAHGELIELDPTLIDAIDRDRRAWVVRRWRKLGWVLIILWFVGSAVYSNLCDG